MKGREQDSLQLAETDTLASLNDEDREWIRRPEQIGVHCLTCPANKVCVGIAVLFHNRCGNDTQVNPREPRVFRAWPQSEGCAHARDGGHEVTPLRRLCKGGARAPAKTRQGQRGLV